MTWNASYAAALAEHERRVLAAMPDDRPETATRELAIQPPANAIPIFLAVLTGAVSLAPRRWKYAWSERRLANNLLVAFAGGRAGTTSSNYAINLNEINNGAAGTGVQGNGINCDNLPGTMQLLQIGQLPAGREVPVAMYDMWALGWGNADGARYGFNLPSPVDGACP